MRYLLVFWLCRRIALILCFPGWQILGEGFVWTLFDSLTLEDDLFFCIVTPHLIPSAHSYGFSWYETRWRLPGFLLCQKYLSCSFYCVAISPTLPSEPWQTLCWWRWSLHAVSCHHLRIRQDTQDTLLIFTRHQLAPPAIVSENKTRYTVRHTLGGVVDLHRH